MKMSDNKQALQVAALKNGTVIDHIPSDKLFTVVALLGLQDSDSNITIGNNFESKKLGKKGIIKVADRFFTDEEISRLSVLVAVCKSLASNLLSLFSSALGIVSDGKITPSATIFF